MKILFSPTKQMDFTTPLPAELSGGAAPVSPLYREEALMLNRSLASLSDDEIASMMKISPGLTASVRKRVGGFPDAPVRPALFTYSGTSFKALEPFSLTPKALRYARKSLRILSAMYGILRPLDGIAPYRLEMKSPLKVDGAGSLKGFWKPRIRKALEGEDVILNLASAEYSGAALPLPGRIIDILFKEEKEGRLRTVGMYAKQARGRMLRRILLSEPEDPLQILAWELEGYRFREELSGEYCWIFSRRAAEK